MREWRNVHNIAHQSSQNGMTRASPVNHHKHPQPQKANKPMKANLG
jgi:hypothetical protein